MKILLTLDDRCARSCKEHITKVNFIKNLKVYWCANFFPKNKEGLFDDYCIEPNEKNFKRYISK